MVILTESEETVALFGWTASFRCTRIASKSDITCASDPSKTVRLVFRIGGSTSLIDFSSSKILLPADTNVWQNPLERVFDLAHHPQIPAYYSALVTFAALSPQSDNRRRYIQSVV
ncbi:MAG TPA: hypothetical protein VGF82_23485 [Terracidiphilus sp.]